MKKIKYWLLVILITAFSPAITFAQISGVVVGIDPGHGGIRPGAIGVNGDALPDEADIVLNVGLHMRDLFTGLGVDVAMTRTTDTELASSNTVDLTWRVNYINAQNPDAFVSVHENSSDDPTADGTETLRHFQSPDTHADLAQRVQTRMLADMGFRDREVKLRDDLLILTVNYAIPTVLTEGCFISNSTEWNYIIQSSNQECHANAIQNGILDYLGHDSYISLDCGVRCPNDPTEPYTEESPKPFGNLVNGCSQDLAEGYICQQGDVDYFGMFAEANGYLTLILSDVPSGLEYQVNLYEYDGNGYVIKSLAPATGSQTGIIQYDNILQNTSYLIIIVGLNNDYNDTEKYTLSLDWEASVDEGLLENLNSFSPLPLITATSTNICIGSSSTLSVELLGAVKWFNDDTDELIDFGTETTVSPNITTTYRIEYFETCNQPPSIETITIYVSSGGQNISISPSSSTISPGESEPLSVLDSDGASCYWSPETGLDNPNSCNPTASPATTTTYTVTTNNGGCESTASVIVQVLGDDGGDDCQQAPPNDNPCDAIQLVPSTSYDITFTLGTNECATSSDILPNSCDDGTSRDVWYSFIMPSSGFARLVTRTGTLNDIEADIFTGTCNNLVYQGCYPNANNPDSPNGEYMPAADFFFSEGVRVFIRLWDYNDNHTGTFGITVTDLGYILNSFSPDLAISFDDVSDRTRLEMGDQITLDCTARNLTVNDASGLIINYIYISDDPYFDTSDTPIFAVNPAILVDGLQGLNSESFETDIVIPDMPSGNYFLISTVDLYISVLTGNFDYGFFYEVEEFNNNYDIYQITIGEDTDLEGVDLSVSSFNLSPDQEVYPGLGLNYSFRIENEGTERTNQDIYVGVYISDDRYIDADDSLFEEFVIEGGLDDDEDVTFSGTWYAPQVDDDGRWYIIVVADNRQLIFEHTEYDNDDYVDIDYISIESDFPDYRGYNLYVEQDNMQTNHVVSEQPYQVKLFIENDGYADASSSSKVRLYRSTNNDISGSIPLDEKTISSLDIEESVQVTFDIDNTTPLEGDYTLIISVDTDDDVFEGQREDNNFVFFPANFALAPDTLLPVEMSSLRAYTQDKMTILEWRTETETNNAGFEIQRSRDGVNFEKIDWVDGYGNTTEPQSYRNHDENPYLGKSYYRLKQMDFDGAFVYSNIVSVTHDEQTTISVYPNPVKDVLHISGIEISHIQQLTIYDTKGRAIQTNSNFSQSLDLSGLPSGVYILEFIIDSGVFVQKIVVAP